MELINENSFATAKYARPLEVVYYEYVGVVNQPLGMVTIRKVMAFAEKNKVRAIVSDLSRMKGTFTGVNEFLEKEYYPHMIKNGLTSTAIILSNDIFTKYATNDLSKRVGNFELQIFETFDAGEAWIMQKVNQSTYSCTNPL
jgi:hypothetical protein